MAYLEGVLGVKESHFWTIDGVKIIGRGLINNRNSEFKVSESGDAQRDAKTKREGRSYLCTRGS